MPLQCGGENMMIDGGSPMYFPRLEAWFEEHDITEFKYLYNTHPDSDHITGLYQIMRSGNYAVGGFYSAVKQDYDGSEYHKYAMQILRRKEVPYVQIIFGDSKVFLPGDCGNEALRYFLENRDHALFECDIMKAQYHGINGIIDDFFAVAQPEFVFVPNRPREVPEDKKKRFDEMGAWYSGEGAIIMETDGCDWYIWQKENIKEAVNK